MIAERSLLHFQLREAVVDLHLLLPDHHLFDQVLQELLLPGPGKAPEVLVEVAQKLLGRSLGLLALPLAG